MQQRFRRLAFFVCAGTLTGAAVLVVACSTDNGTTPTPLFGVDGSRPDGGGTTDGNVEPSEGGDDGGLDAADNADCSNDPVLRDFTQKFRCPFIDGGGPDGGGQYCTNNQACCETNDKTAGGAFEPSYCTAEPTKGVTVANNPPDTCIAAAAGENSTFKSGNQYDCSDKNACPGVTNAVCCFIQDPVQLAAGKKLNIGNAVKNKNHPDGCLVQYVYNGGGTRCRTGPNCPAGEIKLCSMSDPNCGAGTTCTPFVDYQNTERGFCK